MLSVRLDESLERALARFAKRHHITKSETVKRALLYYFQSLEEREKPTPFTLGEELFGRYGIGDGGLSTRYKERLKTKLHAKNRH